MLDRVSCGDLPAKAHTALRGAGDVLRHEECFTRAAFDGPYTIVYHEHRPHVLYPQETPPVVSSSPEPSSTIARGWTLPVPTPPSLVKRHFETGKLSRAAQPPLGAREPMLSSGQLTIGISNPSMTDPIYWSNADADELYFIHEGGGVLRSPLGDVRFEAGDNLNVPKTMVLRFVLGAGQNQRWLVIESTDAIRLPKAFRNEVGQLRMDAPYSHRDFRRPVFAGPVDEGIRNYVVKRQGAFFSMRFAESPLDGVGWDGSVYPFVLPISKFEPRVGAVHLPPSTHLTFETTDAAICSFVPRPLDFYPDAVPCPYPHSSVDIDEVLYYVSGDFTSRRGVGPGSISYHPAGIPHGPHPDAYENSVGAKETSELAVMIDARTPLTVCDGALRVEDPGYDQSFSGGAPRKTS